jgi:enamine deaminase RidA (YjgF/YER057c/UK114 family)
MDFIQLRPIFKFFWNHFYCLETSYITFKLASIFSLGVEPKSNNNMTSAQTFYSPPGPVGELFTKMGISHAAIVPATAKIVITSGEPGLDLKTGELVTSSPEAQVNAAYDTIDLVLKNAGVEKGIRGAHKFTALLIDTKYEDVLMSTWRERYPGHKPVFMAFGVRQLGMEGMIVELRAEAIIE